MLKWPFLANDLLRLIDILQKLISIGAIIVGGIWTYKLFIEHREAYAKADIQHDIAVFDLGRDTVLIRVTVSIQNTGSTLLRVNDGEIRIEQVSPLEQGTLDKVIKESKELYSEAERFWWPVILMKKLEWGHDDFEIEPGERDRIPFEFILSAHLDIINVNTYLANPERHHRLGWNYSTIVDLRKMAK